MTELNVKVAKESLEMKVLEMIIDKLDLDDVNVENFDFDAPIFESYSDEEIGLGLDSVDALELVVGLNEVFELKVSDEDMAIFRSIQSIADYVREEKGME